MKTHLENKYRYEGQVKGPNEIGSIGPKQVPCEAGTFRDTQGGRTQGDCSDCREGYYCPSGSPEETICPLGYFCEARSGSPEPCPAGTFGEKLGLINQDGCTTCTKGYYCNAAGLLQPRGPCDPGFVCYGGAISSSPDEDCTGDPANRVNTANPADPCIGERCPPGGYCPAGTYEPWGCPPGTFADTEGQIDESDCSPCTPGSYCSIENRPEPTGVCQAGCYCEGANDVTNVGAYDICQEPCSRGKFCPSNSTEETPCPEGTYQPQDRKEECLICPPGFKCPEKEMVAPELCGKGYYCEENTDSFTGTACPLGTYSQQDGINQVEQCQSCPLGKYCDIVGSETPGQDCRAGHICTGGSQIPNPTTDEENGRLCPQGAYCPSGALEPIECPIGTYFPNEGADDINDCLDCPQSYNCPVPGITQVIFDGNDDPFRCDDGFVCENKVSRPDPRAADNVADCLNGSDYSNCPGRECPINSFCTGGISELCSLGYYTETEGQSICALCLDGAECDAGQFAQCEQGYYCNGPEDQGPSAFAVKELCPSGTVGLNAGLRSAADCTACDGGTACLTTVTAETENIEAGYFSRSLSTSATPPDEAYCNPLSWALLDDPPNQRCGQCPVGYFCDPTVDQSTIDPTPCSPGTYGDSSGGTDSDSACLSCTDGYFCPNLAMSDTEANSDDFICLDGYDCFHSTNPAFEPAKTGAPIGQMCAEGNFCDRGQAFECTEGTYMNVRGATSRCESTPIGYYQDEIGQTAPKVCGEGRYCEAVGLATDDFLCQAGTYFSGTGLANPDCVRCPPGKYCGSDGMTTDGDDCDAGYKCEGGNINADEDQCQDGYYCDAGSHTELSCPRGFYCTDGINQGQCQAGSYCDYQSTDDTTLCSRGHFCGVGTAVEEECPIGTYQPDEGKDRSDDCNPCPAGFYCDDVNIDQSNDDIVNPSSDDANRQCNAGYQCTSGSTTPFGTTLANDQVDVCEAGYRCPVGTGAQLACGTGEYQPYVGQEECSNCPDGFLCPDTSTKQPCPEGSYCLDNTQIPCPEGSFGHTEGLGSESECRSCPAGHYCTGTGLTEADLDSYKCEAGVYCEEPRQDQWSNDMRISCPRGYYCPEASSYPSACPAGKYNPSEGGRDSNACLDCPDGTACDGLGNSETTQCEAGYYCPAPSQSPRENVCPAGYFCPAGSGTYLDNKCLDGTWSNQAGLSTSEECSDCPDGFLCNPAANQVLDNYNDLPPCNPPGTSAGNWQSCRGGSGTICPVGFKCDDAYSSEPVPCPDGTYQDEEGQEGCKVCEANNLCLFDEQGTPRQSDCENGWICPEETVYNADPCNNGQYMDTPGNCVDCTAGYYCPGIGYETADRQSCESGYFCAEGEKFGSPDKSCDNSYKGDVCPTGQECTGGNAAGDACSSGNFAHITGLDSCMACPAGFGCDDATVFPSDGSCAQNKYCPRGRSPELCSAGTFNNGTVGTSRSACQKCTPGYQCSEGSVPVECGEGKYCPTGTTDDAGNKPPVDCTNGICGAGSYFEEICPMGGVCVGTSIIGDCPDGQYCFTSSDSAETKVDPCSEGYFCDPAVSYEQACPLGTFSGQLGLTLETQCIDCDNGYYCGEIGQTELVRICDDGYDCYSGKNDQPNFTPCPIGYSCDNGVKECCSDSSETFQNLLGQRTCQSCPDGFVCQGPGADCDTSDDQNTIPQPCPEGSYCTGGTTDGTCPAGTYRDIGHGRYENDCFTCEPGFACPSATSGQAPTNECDPGWYCIKGSDETQPNQLTYAGPCPAGHYCPNNRPPFSPIPCPVGTYNSGTGAPDLGECQDCDAGSVCLDEGMTQNGKPCDDGYICDGQDKELCPIGEYCDGDRTDGSTSVPCPAGTWSDKRGLKSVTECYDCPEGFICPDQNLPHTVFTDLDPCPEKFYCPEGSDAGTVCPVGFACPAGTPIPMECPPYHYQDASDGAIECKPCEAQWFCSYGPEENYGQTTVRRSEKVTCPYGYYCPAITSSSTRGSVPCPIGTFGGVNGISQVEECIPCDEGYYCDKPGLTEDEKNNNRCTDGSHCRLGAMTSAPSADVYSCPDRTAPTWYTYNAGPCPAGSSCIGGRLTNCEDNFYSTGSASRCSQCLAGHSCTDTNNHEDAIPCSAGQYCVEGRGESPCPAGTFNPYTGAKDSNACIDCPAGQYCDTDGQEDSSLAQPCEAGYYCDGGDSTATPTTKRCTNSDLCEEGSTFKQPCNPGMKCDGSQTVGFCDATNYCYIDNNRYTTSQCPRGHKCDGNGLYPIACPRGEYQSDFRQNECRDCETFVCNSVGTVSSTGAETCYDGFKCETSGAGVDRKDFEECAKGEYCSNGRVSTCSDGTYQDSVGQSQCLVCFPGFSCSDENNRGSSVADLCVAGEYCERQDANRDRVEVDQNVAADYGKIIDGSGIDLITSKCPKGTFVGETGSDKIEDCNPCTAGLACDERGLAAPDPTKTCTAGYYCIMGAPRVNPSRVNDEDAGVITGTCQKGNYCEENIAYQQMCPLATYGRSDRITSVDDCRDCDGGKYCDVPGLTSSDVIADEISAEICKAGFYCETGQSHSYNNPAPAGTYADEGSSQASDCSSGTFSTSEYLESREECSPCPIGKACPTKGIGSINDLEDCTAGYFCPGGSSKVTDRSCLNNHYCPGGDSFAKQCPLGSFSSGTRSTACNTCENGKLCSPEYQSGTSSSTIDCPEGHYCNYDDVTQSNILSNPKRCPLGRFNADKKAQDLDGCTRCPRGSYCDGSQPWLDEDEAANDCAGGFICEVAAFAEYPFDISDPVYDTCSGLADLTDTSSRECVAGEGCPPGSQFDIDCQPGYYTAVDKAEECIECPPGYDCFESNISDYTLEDPDNPGNGKYQCPPGHYCPAGQKSECPRGTYNPRPYAADSDDCIPCPGGFRCPNTATSDGRAVPCEAGFYCEAGSFDQRECTAGSYCPAESVLPISCPAGKNCAQDGLGDIAVVPDCNEGFYCPPGTNGAEVSPVECPAGYYCPEGTRYQVPCPPGTFGPSARGVDSSVCENCPYGHYCPGYSNAGPVEDLPKCQAGFYCPEGSSGRAPFPCPRGYHCPADNSEQNPLPCSGSQTEADGGVYQDGLGAIECKTCPAGYYCTDLRPVFKLILYKLANSFVG